MSKRKRKGGNQVRDATMSKSTLAWFVNEGDYSSLCVKGYTRLSDNPEVLMAVNKIASLIGSMTIHLLANSDSGDIRIKNELSRKIDINPNRYMTRMTLISWIVRTLMLEGDGNAVVLPLTERGYLGDLTPVPHDEVTFVPLSPFGYQVRINGKDHDPGSLLHFVLNPDPKHPWKGAGFRVALREVVKSLAQASATKQGFMSDKWKPSIIVKVDALTDEFASKDGRSALLEQYVASNKAGEPWLIPSDGFQIEQVRPLSLNDLAISDTVTLDKKTVAAILGVPAFVVGAGAFNREEWNAFINTTILPIVMALEQELTRKLLISQDMHFHMNPWALYAYDIQQLASIGSNLYIRGVVTGNEVRSWIGLGPKDGLDELVILENFIPLEAAGNQKKLNNNTDGGEN